MNPAVDLLIAYLRRAKEQNAVLFAAAGKLQERNVELKKIADNLRSELNYARKSRDTWKEKALAYRQRWKLADSNLRSVRASREMWKHRALMAQLVEDVVGTSTRSRRPSAAMTPSTTGSPSNSIGTPTWKAWFGGSGFASRRRTSS